MDLEFSPAERAFEQEVREFLREHLPAHIVEATRRTTTVFVDKDVALEWQGILALKGWAVPSWPEEWGGTGWSPAQRYIFTRECFRAGAPMLIPLGLGMLAPVLLAFGTDAQKREHLPKILSGENYWCQGYSEPGSGSDLASLQLKAARHDDHYLLNGSKLWTTHAHFADHIFCLVRTDGSGRPQQGISFLLVPLDLPGIEVRPIVTMGMSHEVNQVFFTDVRVPLENRVGEEGRGWSYAKYLLEFERGGGMSSGLRLRELDEAVALHAALAAEGEGFDADGAFRKRLARIAIDVRALELTELRLLSVLAAGGAPGPESSVLKLCSVEVEQRVHELCVQMIGHHALVFAAEPSTGVPLPLAVPDYAQAVVGRYLNGRAASIFGGSQEVQRNIIAKAVLGL